jgi:hypothetical protein
MISRHVDIIAVIALLLGILIWSEARQSYWVYVVNRRPMKVRQIFIRLPEPPVVPIVFK